MRVADREQPTAEPQTAHGHRRVLTGHRAPPPRLAWATRRGGRGAYSPVPELRPAAYCSARAWRGLTQTRRASTTVVNVNTSAVTTVIRSRFRSTTVDPAIEPPIWPPNMSDSPPPRPACS